MGDDRIVRAVRRGTVTFQRESMPPLKVEDVLHVPGLKKNLISISQIEDKGFDVAFRRGQVIMHPTGSLVDSGKVIGTRKGKLYRFAFQPQRALVSSVEDSTTSTFDSRDLCELWHWRMAHMHHGALRVLREITIGVPQFSTDHYEVCRGCALGKYTKLPFPARDCRSTGKLDLIHSDVSGRMSHVSLGGYEYYVLFIDDYSRMTWIYFLKTKSEVFKRFREFKALVEKQTGRKIQALRSENGGEYTDGGFAEFCTHEGIRREFTVPYNPQLNGVSERKNKTIIDAAKAMIHDQGLPLFLWAEACSTAVYL